MKNIYIISYVIFALSAILLLGCHFHGNGDVSDSKRGGDGRFYIENRPETPDLSPPAVPAPDAEPLSLAECIETALLNSPKARRSLQITRAEAARAGRARAPMLPQMEFEASAARHEQRREKYDASFGVRQLLFDFGTTRAERDSAESALLSSKLRHNDLLMDVALETQMNYYRLLNAKARLEAAEESVKQRKKHVEMAEVRYKTGVANKSEVLQTQVLLSQAELEVVNERSRIRDAHGRLAVSMGLRPSAEFEVRDIPEEVIGQELADAAVLMDQAIERRPALQSAAAEVMSVKGMLRAEESARWPVLSGTARAGRTGDKILPPDEEWTLGLNLNWPIFTGFDRTHRIKEQEALVEAAAKEYEDKLRGVELQVWEAYSELLRAVQVISSAEVYLESARESLRVVEAEYEEGQIGIVELTDAQTNFTHARVSRAEARLDWHMALGKLERAVGKEIVDTVR